MARIKEAQALAWPVDGTWQDSVFCSERFLDNAILTSLLKLTLTDRESERLSRALLAQFSTLSGVVHASQSQMALAVDLPTKALHALSIVKAALSAVSRVPESGKPIFANVDQLMRYIRYSQAHAQVEHFRVLFCNQRFELLQDHTLSIGTIDEVSANPRDIMRHALEVGAVELILIHNHPSGSLTPSREDKQATKAIAEAGKLFKVRVHDHLIVSREGFSSMRLLGLLNEAIEQPSKAA